MTVKFCNFDEPYYHLRKIRFCFNTIMNMLLHNYFCQTANTLITNNTLNLDERSRNYDGTGKTYCYLGFSKIFEHVSTSNAILMFSNLPLF